MLLQAGEMSGMKKWAIRMFVRQKASEKQSF